MIDDETDSIAKRPTHGMRFLMCDPTGRLGELSSPEEKWVGSPIQCFDQAVDGKPRIIVIRFGRMPIRDREALVELIVALKRNSHTRKCPILALFHSKHRKLLEDLNRADVEFATYVEDTSLDSAQVQGIIDGLGPDDRLQRNLATVCPFLHYSPIDFQHEMEVCGAYLDRMVLGSPILHEICETEKHFDCQYYLNPRLKS